jgi:23S rRNA (uracil1939-C5)-methyltransferase
MPGGGSLNGLLVQTENTDSVVVSIDQMALGGDGVGRLQEYVIFAHGGLPGERVRVALHTRRKNYAQGKVVEVLTSSPERIAPRLPGADHIPWQHIAYDAQLRFKQAIVREQLEKYTQVSNPPVESVIPAASPWNYRNKTTLHGKGQGANSQIGYYAAGTHEVQDIVEDPLLLPVLNETLAGLRATLPTGPWQVESVILRGSSTYGETIAVMRGKGQLRNLVKQWKRRAPALRGCLIEQVRTLRRQAPDPPAISLHEALGGITFLLAPTSFFQVHTAQAEVLLDVVRRGLNGQAGERVLDAYSGVGTFALPLSQEVGEVVAVEEHPQAVADGERTARQNNITNVRFMVSSLERAISTPELSLDTFDAAILDPPRRGCHPIVMSGLATHPPQRLVYVSCNPGGLAQNVQVLLERGYHLAWVQPVDMFPQTPHIECVALLVREPPVICQSATHR